MSEKKRDLRLRQVLDEYLSRRAQGEHISIDVLIDQHSDLIPELAVECRKLELIDKARMLAANNESPESDPTEEASHDQSLLLLRCPHCQMRFQITEEASWPSPLNLIHIE